ncbi:hypothetical protein BDQ12DRAFT_669120 [Crucibulum laeve]|uniref:Uncharacterized protein n=1 Tax=Crucibulum laeve TaxID=68775 RepID=A0A5C3LRR7_9AGAR|nr:hypothetical protein BDQ12DRAFT_669120 [Crucibulum laeve]
MPVIAAELRLIYDTGAAATLFSRATDRSRRVEEGLVASIQRENTVVDASDANSDDDAHDTCLETDFHKQRRRTLEAEIKCLEAERSVHISKKERYDAKRLKIEAEERLLLLKKVVQDRERTVVSAEKKKDSRKSQSLTTQDDPRYDPWYDPAYNPQTYTSKPPKIPRLPAPVSRTSDFSCARFEPYSLSPPTSASATPPLHHSYYYPAQNTSILYTPLPSHYAHFPSPRIITSPPAEGPTVVPPPHNRWSPWQSNAQLAVGCPNFIPL